MPAAYHVAINGAFLAIKAMERMKVRCGYQTGEINFYENLPPEAQKRVDKFLSVACEGGVKDESESD